MEESGRILSQSNISGVYLAEKENPRKISEIPCPIRDLNAGCSECEAGVLKTRNVFIFVYAKSSIMF
jgi:hypothetical protein